MVVLPDVCYVMLGSYLEDMTFTQSVLSKVWILQSKIHPYLVGSDVGETCSLSQRKYLFSSTPYEEMYAIFHILRYIFLCPDKF